MVIDKDNNDGKRKVEPSPWNKIERREVIVLVVVVCWRERRER
jgi:hypothetical protein